MQTHEAHGWFPIAPGILRKTVASGERMMQMIVQLEAGSRLPEHRHPHEQLTYLVSGRLRLYLDGVAHDLGPGDSLLIPGGVLHSAEVLAESVALDTFCPPREDLLAQDRAGRTA
jgi:quercetin dioxygenase-like cupin family protein